MNKECSFCSDPRNIIPARLCTCKDERFKEVIQKAIDNKEFIYQFDDSREDVICSTEFCPKCTYVFTEDDYDNYEELINN